MIDQIREEKVEFIGSVVLGLNDALIELTGALLGFSFMFSDHWLVSRRGRRDGISAGLSMSSSAYIQARHEPGKNPRKAATLYGGFLLRGGFSPDPALSPHGKPPCPSRQCSAPSSYHHDDVLLYFGDI